MIVRVLLFLALLMLLGFGFSWLADRPGELFILWQGRRIEMTLLVAASLLAALIFTILIVWWAIRSILTSPRTLSRYFRARNRDRGYQALSTGLIAAGAGNAALARKMHMRAKGLLRADQEPLLHLLEAQSALIEGRYDEARVKFEQLSQDPETRELGLRGLYYEATHHGAREAARQYAEKALETSPHLPWAVEATLEYRTQAGRFDDAIRLLESQSSQPGADRKQMQRKKAVLLTGRAMSKLENDPKGAREDAVYALKLAPELVPAALMAAKGYFRENNARKAFLTLESAFRRVVHPEIVAAYSRGSGGDTAVERLKRAKKLESLQPGTYEALYGVAAGALDAREFSLARQKAQAAALVRNCESLYLLMADIEEAESGDQGRIRHWLATALNAPRDPAWVADGQVSPYWLPASPQSGRLDAFEWKAPFAENSAMIDNDTMAIQAFASLPGAQPQSQPAVLQTKAPEAPKPVPPPASAPFFGHPPDDPGVKDKESRRVEPPNSRRLF